MSTPSYIMLFTALFSPQETEEEEEKAMVNSGRVGRAGGETGVGDISQDDGRIHLKNALSSHELGNMNSCIMSEIA